MEKEIFWFYGDGILCSGMQRYRICSRYFHEE